MLGRTMLRRILLLTMPLVLAAACSLTPQQQRLLDARPTANPLPTGRAVTENGVVCRYGGGASAVRQGVGAPC